MTQPSNPGDLDIVGLVRSLRPAMAEDENLGIEVEHIAPAMPDPISVEAKMRDALQSIRKHCAIQPSALAKAIVATCDAALANDAQSVPEGMVLVPRVPTEAMLDAYWKQTGESREMRARTHSYMRRYWSAMIAATHPEAVSQVGEAK